MQERVVALATTLILLGVGLMAQHHRAEAAHVREESGRIVHSQELADHHVIGVNAHVHNSGAHDHAGACSLLALAHERVVLADPHPATAAVAVASVLASPTPRTRHAVAAAYRLAPKTSPPALG